MDKVVGEAFNQGLIRVLKTIKRRLSDGRTVDHEQAFYVRKAAPGDKYDHGQGLDIDSTEQLPQQAQPEVAPEQPAPEQMPPEQMAPPPPPKRITVKALELPWELDGLKKKPDAADPIPPELRSRFDQTNKMARVPQPFIPGAPTGGVEPGEAIMWGANEPDIINRLRTGTIVGLRVAGAHNGSMLARVESSDGAIRKAYIKLEGLADPFVYDAWGDIYGLKRGDGSLSRRAAAAYDVAKAAGLDDLVPPTTYRNDEYGDLGPILSQDLIERRETYCESIARVTGEDPGKLRKRLRGFAALQLFTEGVRTIDAEKWFRALFSGDDIQQNDGLNEFFGSLPERMRIAFLRGAAFDYLIWAADRGLPGLLFCGSDKHPLHLVDNELCLPDPRKLAEAFSEHGGSYIDETPLSPKHMPLLWSDLLLALAIRGGSHELHLFEQIGVEIAARLRDERAVELARTLGEYQISPLAVAGTLVRAYALGTHSQRIAKNPLLIAGYYNDLIRGQLPVGPSGNMAEVPLSIELSHVLPKVNAAMSKAMEREYNFVAEIRGDGDARNQ